MTVLTQIGRRLAPLSPFPGDGLSRAAVVTLVALFLLGVLAPVLPVGEPEEIGVGPRLGAPALGWPFGTDSLGRSMLPRVLEGIRLTLVLSTTAVLVAAIVGAVVGMLAAATHRFVDETISRAADVLFSFPPVLLGLLATAIIGPGATSAASAIVLITLPAMVRVVRAAALDVAGRDFVAVAEIAGASLGRRLFVHLLPNVAGVIAVQTAYSISLGMLIESALSFLGLGVQPPFASLGSLLREGSKYLTVAPWLVFAPGIVLALAILCVNLVGDGLRRIVDPLEPRPLR
jgi:peptide/nickel transport system permease protein